MESDSSLNWEDLFLMLRESSKEGEAAIDLENLRKDAVGLSRKQALLRFKILAKNLGVPPGVEEFLLAEFTLAFRDSQPTRSDLREIISEATHQPIGQGGQETGLLLSYEQRVVRLLDSSPTGLTTGDLGGASGPWVEYFPLSGKWPREIIQHPSWTQIESPIPGVASLPLSGSWIDLTLTEVGEQETPSSLDTAAWQDLSFDQPGVGESLQEVVLKTRGLTVVFGLPGAGKSTCLKWIVRYVVTEEECPFCIPIFVSLRQFSMELRENPGLSFLEHFLGRRGIIGESDLNKWRSLFSGLLDPPESLSHLRSGLIWLLDGWDEVPSDMKARVREKIDEIALYPAILTSRLTGDSMSLPARSRYQIQGLKGNSALNLAYLWLKGNGKEEYFGGLEEAVESSSDLKRMVRSPFLLTLLCALASDPQRRAEGFELRSRGDVLRETIFLIYRHHNQDSKQEHQFRVTDKAQIAHFCYWLLAEDDDSPRFLFEEADYVRSGGEENRFADLLTPSRLIASFAVDTEDFQFLHANFQEYLAAEFLLSDPETVAQKAKLLFSSHLKEVGRFLAGEVQPGTEAWQILWKEARQMADELDQFGIVAARLASWLTASDVRDGGVELLGKDIREELWSVIVPFSSMVPTLLIEALLELDSTYFARRILDLRIEKQRNVSQVHWLGLVHYISLEPLLEIEKYREVLAIPEVGIACEYLPDSITSRRDLDNEPSERFLKAIEFSSKTNQLDGLRTLFWDNFDEQDVDVLMEGIQRFGFLAQEQAGELLLEIATSCRVDDLVRGAAVAALVESGLSATRGIFEFLIDQPLDHPCVFAILSNLEGYLLTDLESELILEYLRDCPDSDSREAAAEILTCSRSTTLSENLVKMFTSEKVDGVRASILETLLQVGDALDLRRIWELRKEVAKKGREYELWVRVVLKVSKEVRAKLTCFGDSRNALGMLSDIELELRNEFESNWARRFEECSGFEMVMFEFPEVLGERVEEYIGEAVVDSRRELELRVEAARAVGRLELHSMIPFLIETASSEVLVSEPRLRQAVCDSLGQLAPDRLKEVGCDEAELVMARLAFRRQFLFFQDRVVDSNGKAIGPGTMSDVNMKTFDPILKADVAVYIALKEEFLLFTRLVEEAVGEKGQLIPDSKKSVSFYHLRTSEENFGAQINLVAVCPLLMGPTNAANVSSLLVDRFEPDVLVSIGISGSISRDLLLGDVLIPKEVVAYFENSAAVGSDSEKGWDLQISGTHSACDSHLFNQAGHFDQSEEESFKEWSKSGENRLSKKLGKVLSLQAQTLKHTASAPNLVVGDHVLATGPTVGKSSEFADWLQKNNRKSHAVDMETASVWTAGHSNINPPRLFAIRGISDFGDERKAEVEEKYDEEFREIAMSNATDFFLRMARAKLFKGD